MSQYSVLKWNVWKIKAKWDLHKYAACRFEWVLVAAPYKRAVARPFTSHFANIQENELDIQNSVGEAKM